MHEQTLHAIAKAIAENRDLAIGHVESVKSELSEKIAAIEPGVNASFVENYVAKTEGKLTEVLTEAITATVKAGMESLGGTFSSTVEAVKVEAVGGLESTVKQIAEVRTEFGEAVNNASKTNDDTLLLVGKRFEEYDETISSIQDRQVAIDASVEIVQSQLQEAVESSDKSLLSLANSVANATEELEVGIKEVGDRVEEMKGHSQDLHNILLRTLKDERNIKQWAAGVHRVGTIVKCNFGDQYIANCDTVSEPSIDNNEWTIVQQGFRFKGLYVEGNQYANGDIVVKDGATWLHDNERLNLLAMRGERGPRGKKGENGDKGENGLSEPEIKALVSTALNDVHALTVDIAGETASNTVKALFAPPDDYALPLNFFRGQWQGDVDYRVGDQVLFVSASYLCQVPNRNTAPQGGGGHWVPTSPMAAISGGVVTAANSGGGVSSVTATAPLTSTGGATPRIAMPQATATIDGFIAATDWARFDGKQAPATTLAGYGITNAYTKAEVDALINSRAPASHTHTIGNVTGLQTALDGKLGVLENAVSSSVAGTVDDLNAAPTLSQWVGTQAQYNALGTYSPTTFYTITDAVPLGSTPFMPSEYISKAKIKEVLMDSNNYQQFKAKILALI